jgi:hypothetical protein
MLKGNSTVKAKWYDHSYADSGLGDVRESRFRIGRGIWGPALTRLKKTVSALQSEIASLRSEVTSLRGEWAKTAIIDAARLFDLVLVVGRVPAVESGILAYRSRNGLPRIICGTRCFRGWTG